MYGDDESKEPPQSVYYTFFGIAVILLAVTAFKYPLW
jgi:hypothetical protein